MSAAEVIAIKRRHVRTATAILTIITFIAIGSGVWFARQVRQQLLDRALISAIKKHDVAAVIMLLDRGANANARDRPYEPVTLSAEIKKLFAQLRSHKGGSTGSDYPTALASTYGAVAYNPPDTSIVVFLNSNSVTGFESSRAKPDDPYRIVSALFDHGALLGTDDNSGSSLLSYACMCNHAKTVELLLKHKAGPNRIQTLFADSDFTPLMCTDNYACIRLLLEHGANVNARDRGGRTRLMYVYDIEVYSLLMNYGADPNIQDSDGETALARLFESMYLPDSNIIYGTKFLLTHGAKASIKDKKGYTACDYARCSKSNFMSSSRLTPGFDSGSIRLLEAAMKREKALKRN